MTVDDRQVLGRVLDRARDTCARDPRRTFLKSFLGPALLFAAIIACALFLARAQGWVHASDPVMNPLFWAIAGLLLVLWGCAEFARARRTWRAQRRRLEALESDWAVGQLAVHKVEIKSAVRIDTPGASALALLERADDRIIIIDARALDSPDAGPAQDVRAPYVFELKWCPASALTLPIPLPGDTSGVPIAGPIALDVLPTDAPDGIALRDAPEPLREALAR